MPARMLLDSTDYIPVAATSEQGIPTDDVSDVCIYSSVIHKKMLSNLSPQGQLARLTSPSFPLSKQKQTKID